MDCINSIGLEPGKTAYLDMIAGKVRGLMTPGLFRHSVNTLESCIEIAENCGLEVDMFMLCLASIVHDYGKIFSTGELEDIARRDRLSISDFELGLKPILHSLVGDYLVSRDLGIKDSRVLRAVKVHTIGAVDMTLEEKILFVADKVEKGRKYSGVEHLRDLALKDINLCLIEVYKNTIIYVMNKKSLLHPDTAGIWNSICGGN